MDPVKGLLYLGAQFLGVFVAFKLAGVLGAGDDHMAQDNAAKFLGADFSKWRGGIKEAIAISVFLWCWLHEGETGDMPKTIFKLLAVAVVFMFHKETVFSFSRYFQSAAAIQTCGPYFVWGLVATILTHVKRVLCGFEDKWFFQSDDVEVSLDDQEKEEEQAMTEEA